MIYGVGIDLVRIARVDSALSRFGDRFAKRILTDAEFKTFADYRRQTDFLAKHFAAKEALSKALGTGFRQGFSWREVEVRHEPGGRPYLACSGRTQEMLDERGIRECHLSLTDETDYAAAFVVLVSSRA